MSDAVVRRWQAKIARSDLDAWRDTFIDRAFPGMKAIAGYRGIEVQVERAQDPCLMTVLTYWEDMDAVRRYAGQEPSRTVMPDFMARFFPEYDLHATFHDVVQLETNA